MSIVFIVVAVGLILMSDIVLVVLPVIAIHMYVAGSVLQCPPVQVAVMLTSGNKPSSQVKVMDDPSNVVV